MKFTSVIRLSGVLLLSVMFSGCANLDLGLNQQPKAPPQLDEVKTPVDPTPTETQIEARDPFEQKIIDLKQQRNLYLASPPPLSDAIKSTYAEGLRLKQQGDLPRAEGVFSQLSQQHPELSGPYLQLGDIAWQRYLQAVDADTDKAQASMLDAVNFLRQAVDINPANYFAHNRLARVYREQGQFERAEQHYQLALKSWPAFDKAYLNLGILYDLYTGDKAKALQHYKIYQALQGKPGRKVQGWIADLNRQVESQDKGQQESGQ